MRCYKVRGLLALFLDSQLSQRQTLKVKAHLDKCAGCSKELSLLKGSWDLLSEWKPIAPSPNFKANLWQRILQEEIPLEKEKVFVFPKLLPRLAPAFATLALILIISVYLMHFFSIPNLQHLVLLTKGQDIQMLEEFELTEELEVIQNFHILEDFEIINSMKL